MRGLGETLTSLGSVAVTSGTRFAGQMLPGGVFEMQARATPAPEIVN